MKVANHTNFEMEIIIFRDLRKKCVNISKWDADNYMSGTALTGFIHAYDMFEDETYCDRNILLVWSGSSCVLT